MCGIAGFIPCEGMLPDQTLIESMTARLSHRGPDGAGYFRDSKIALGHRRLSIIDLTGGTQPLGNEDGSIQVTFNGEIYNFRELHQELVARGHIFRTHSDTEVLVHLYEEQGERLPEFLNGMYAFAIWDATRRELFLARDRMGKKPLYYAEHMGELRFCFASELKALAVAPGFDGRVDSESMVDMLTLGYVPDPQSIFQGIRKLEPGHSLTVTASGIRKRCYWKPEFHSCGDIDANKAAEEIRALAVDAVGRRMISDVPLGAFLSGGVDSSAVVACMAEQAPDRVKTFSIGFTSKAHDELEYASIIAARYHTDHHQMVVTPVIEEMFDKLVQHYDEPFADSSAIPMLYLSRMTRQQVTVALSGDGADEVFAGYRLYKFGVIESQWRDRFPSWFRKSAIRTAGRLYPKLDYMPRGLRAKSLLTNLSIELGEAHFHSRSNFTEADLKRLLSHDLQRECSGYSPVRKMADHFSSVAHLAPLEQMQAVDYRTYLPGDILVKADRATMAYSLESRAPWLDYRMVELAGRLPWQVKLCGGTGKFIFKKAVAPWVPEKLLNRQKMGFSVPMKQWMKTSLALIFPALVLRPEMERYLQLDQVKHLWRQHQSGIADHSRRLWAILMLAAWDMQRSNWKEMFQLRKVSPAAMV
jgi:asparagine synthase (glutamine-hydrolysing)